MNRTRPNLGRAAETKSKAEQDLPASKTKIRPAACRWNSKHEKTESAARAPIEKYEARRKNQVANRSAWMALESRPAVKAQLEKSTRVCAGSKIHEQKIRGGKSGCAPCLRWQDRDRQRGESEQENPRLGTARSRTGEQKSNAS
jgi:hypothetical protein